MVHLETNVKSISSFFSKHELDNAIALLGASSKGDEEVGCRGERAGWCIQPHVTFSICS